MNHYTLADMRPGLTESFTVTVTPEMMDHFYAVTGDGSPIHMDEDYARGRGYPGRVVYGMLGDMLTVTGTVISVSEAVSEAEIKAVITNQDGKKVTRGIIKAGLAK